MCLSHTIVSPTWLNAKKGFEDFQIVPKKDHATINGRPALTHFHPTFGEGKIPPRRPLAFMCSRSVGAKALPVFGQSFVCLQGYSWRQME